VEVDAYVPAALSAIETVPALGAAVSTITMFDTGEVPWFETRSETLLR
jgi:hypothetical protein